MTEACFTILDEAYSEAKIDVQISSASGRAAFECTRLVCKTALSIVLASIHERRRNFQKAIDSL